MASQYGITISMNPATATGLNANGFNLYAFKAVQGPESGKPLVWFKTTTYSQSTLITWTEAYQAYTSKSVALTANTQITAAATYAIDLGEVLNVTDATGGATVTVPQGGATGAAATAITILNGTSQPFTCGISQAQGDGTYQPMCAFPLFGNNADLIIPIEKVLLMFATNAVNTGSVIEQSFSQGVLVDLTDTPQRAVAFDINTGWTAQPWATLQPANTNLVPLLITSGD